MGQKSIKITIGGRVYPLTITDKEEEAVLKSAKKIEENIAKLKSQYKIKDSQDLLAMTALELATQLQKKTSVPVTSNLTELDTKLDEVVELLQKIN